MKTRFLVISAIAVASVLVFFVVDSINLDRLCAENGGVRNGDMCIIETLETEIDETDIDESIFDFSKVITMKPNTMEFFYYPNPEDTTNRDVFQKFILIRLPEELGGDEDNVSAFRAYSALSVGVHCQIKYWPHEERKRMEDPCWGSMYRPIDGLMIAGERPVVNTKPVALPYLDLSMDENGSLHVEPPMWTLNENGVVGEGRVISLQQIRQGSQVIIDSYEQTNPNHPKITVNFAGQILTQINPDTNRMEALYHDFLSHDWHGMTIRIGNVSAQDQKYFLNLAKSNSELWQIDNTTIRIWGSALDENNEQPEGFREYNVEFILDGFKFTINGKNIDLMKKAIIANYFPENSYNDMFLVSSPVRE